jgi:hypothetical protein
VTVRGYGIPGNYYDVQRASDMNFTMDVIILTTPDGIPAAQNGVISYTDQSPPNQNGFYRFIVH